jgi:hypothetical protein
MLCDACLYKVEANNGEVLVADMCKRCRKKILTELLEITTEVADHERLLEDWEP